MIASPPRYRPTSLSINMYAPECLGPFCRALSVSAPANVTNVQNLAWLYPFRLFETATFTRAYVYNGTTANGNWDVGIYSDDFDRLASTGAVAQTGTSVINAANLTASISLAPGRYYIAMSSSSATATFFAITVTAAIARAGGVTEMAAAHVLPTTITPAAFAQTIMPFFGISRRTLVV